MGGGVERAGETVDEVGLERVGEEEDRTADGGGEALRMREWREMYAEDVSRVVHVPRDVEVLHELVALAELRALRDFVVQPIGLSHDARRLREPSSRQP